MSTRNDTPIMSHITIGGQALCQHPTWGTTAWGDKPSHCNYPSRRAARRAARELGKSFCMVRAVDGLCPREHD